MHFLNPVPIRLIHDRWVSKYAQRWVAALSDIKETLEASMEKVYEIYIRTTPERLWEAITDPDIRAKYQFGATVASEWTPGAHLEMASRNTGAVLGDGEVIEADPPRRLVHSMRALWSDDVAQEGFSRVTWEIQQINDSCCLTVTHDQLREGANDQLYGGWPMILSGLKTWLETGQLLTTPGSLMYESFQRVLCVVAHPDDTEYGTSAAVARWTARGIEVGYLLLTRGEAGMPNPPQETARLRVVEQQAACATVGVKHLTVLEHPDGVLVYGLDLRRDICREIRRFKPDVVLGAGYEIDTPYGFDQADHRAAGLATLDAVRDAGNRWVFPEQIDDEGLEPHSVRWYIVPGLAGLRRDPRRRCHR